MKKYAYLVMTLVFVLFFAKVSLAQEIPILPGTEGGCFGSYLNDQPPVIGDVKQDPAEAVAGQAVKIIAKIANDEEKTDDTTVSATLHYSADGGKTFTEVELTQDEKDEKMWSGEIPAQAADTEVIYYLSAVDTSNNLTTELPGQNSVWPPEKDKALVLSPVVQDEDCDEGTAKADLDILEVQVGYDEKTIYGHIKVQGKINGGTMSPTFIHAYGAGILNPDKGEDILKGTALLFAPLLAAAGGSALGWTGDTFCIDARVAETKAPIPQNESGCEAKADGGDLYFKLNRSLLGANPSGVIKILAAAAASTTTDVSALTTGILPQDASPYLYIYLRNHTYKVK